MDEEDINAKPILGFKYSEASQTSITLTPNHGSRNILFFRNDEFFENCWVEILEPHHDSNKLYASCRGLPTETWVDLNLEDLGLETNDFTGGGLFRGNVGIQKLIGSGWMTSDQRQKNSVVMLVCAGTKGSDLWKIKKVSVNSDVDISELISKLLKDDNQIAASNLIVPVIQPQRVVSEQGVYFVG
ncbi:hypothetical protein HK098_007108 [Nowakowskiella sp. JEL0407]|nr:hypothetical protein HK098_007108 [Nowakowskiella sp. JEL0407]